MDVETNDGSASPGLVFITPFPRSDKPMVGQAGPLILEADGNPVWVHPVPAGEQALDFRAQPYLGKPVLTWWQGTLAAPPLSTLPAGSPQAGARFCIYNQHYLQLKKVIAVGGWTVDPGAFLLTRRNSALFIAYKTVPADLAPCGGPAAGEVEDAEIQEVSLTTGVLRFSWDMLEHVPLSQSETAPPATGVWDPYQVNSVQELRHGRLLVSARNTWAVYELERATGKTLWQLGGRDSTFKQTPTAAFSWQNDVQLRHGDEVSMLDDGCCALLAGGLGPPQQASHGLVVKLDDPTGTATAVAQYPHTPALHVSSLGTMQPSPMGTCSSAGASRPPTPNTHPTAASSTRPVCPPRTPPTVPCGCAGKGCR